MFELLGKDPLVNHVNAFIAFDVIYHNIYKFTIII